MFTTAKRLIFSPKGRAPVPWDHQLANPATARDKPDIVDRESALLRRIAWQQWLTGGILVVLILAGVNQYRLTQQIQPEMRPYVIEVSDLGQVRTVGQLPQEPYKPRPADMVFVIKLWLFHTRTVGDSKVLLGQAWEQAQAFTAEKMLGKWRELIQDRHAIFQRHHTVEISTPVIVPLATTGRVFRATWDETTRDMSGGVVKKKRFDANLTVQVNPPPTLQAQRQWRNDLGMVISQFDWLEL